MRLRYVSDQLGGYTRKANGHGFVYFNCRGVRIRDDRLIERINSLAIPPAWREVWICRSGKGHLQATGRDARKRKQYLYHQRWGEISNLAKFWRLRDFGKALPAIRETVHRHMRGAN